MILQMAVIFRKHKGAVKDIWVYSIAVRFYYRCPEPRTPSPEELSWYVRAHEDSLCDKTTVFGSVLKKFELACVKDLRTSLYFRFWKAVSY